MEKKEPYDPDQDLFNLKSQPKHLSEYQKRNKNSLFTSKDNFYEDSKSGNKRFRNLFDQTSENEVNSSQYIWDKIRRWGQNDMQ